jgi:spoIIIJ-associated protein
MNDAVDRSRIEEIVRTITTYLQVPCEVSVAAADDAGHGVTVNLTAAENGRFLIGKGGQNLRALETVVRSMISRGAPRPVPLTVDVNDYRKQQQEELVSHIHEIAGRVRETRKAEALNPMTAYERRIVHTELAVYHDVVSESVGQEPHRRVVVRPV